LSREQRAEAREEIKDKIRATLDELEALRLNRPPFLAALRADELEEGQIGRMPSNLVGAAAQKRLGEGRSGVRVTLHYEVVDVLGPRDAILRILEFYDGGERGYARGMTLWVRGISTKGWGKGQGVDVDSAFDAFEVIGIRAYKAPTGATQSVVLVQQFDVTPWLKHFPQGEAP
jgi:hypothetical protein